MKKILPLLLIATIIFLPNHFPITAATPASDWPIKSVSVSTAQSSYPKENLIDGNTSTYWSSENYSDPNHAENVAILFDGYYTTNYIKVHPQYSSGKGVAFPVDFTIRYSDGSQWITLYTFTAFPNPHDDWIILPFGKTVTAQGVRINATTLATNTNGKYTFHLAEIRGGYDPGFETLQFVGMDGPAGYTLFDGVGAGPFNPNKLNNWNYDYRQPLQTSACSDKKNIYSHQAQWSESTQQWYIYYGGQDTVSNSNCSSARDRIYMTTADTNFKINTASNKMIIDVGSFHHVNNPALTRADDGTWSMVYTAAWDSSPGSGDAANNRPAYATSSDGITWSPSNAGDPNGSNALITMSNYHNGDWNTQYINNQNGLLYDAGKYWYYWGPEGLGGKEYRGYSTNMKNFTEEGAVMQSAYHSVNDVKKFRWNGSNYYLLLAQQNTGAVYSSVATHPASFPTEQQLFPSLENAESGLDNAKDDYIVSAGAVVKDNILYGVLYGAASTSSLNDNKLYAAWLQKKVYFSNESVGWGSIERAVGPNSLRLGMTSSNSVETGTVNIYDTDGTTLLYTSPKMTIVSGMHWQYNSSVGPCGMPATGDWIITSDCSVGDVVTAPSSVIVQNNATLTVGPSGAIDIDEQKYSLRIQNGSRVNIQNGGKIN